MVEVWGADSLKTPAGCTKTAKEVKRDLAVLAGPNWAAANVFGGNIMSYSDHMAHL